jgi:hypothetical protein
VVDQSFDIDTLSFKETTIGDYINDPKNSEPVLAYLREGFQAYRSNPPLVFTFRLHINQILDGTEQMSDFEGFLKDKIFNVDLIKYDEKRTFAEKLHEHERGKIVLQLAQIASFNKSAHEFKKLLELALDDGIIDTLKDYYEKIPLGVDELLFAPGKTIGQYISEQIGRRKGALAVARLVQPGRTDKDAVISALYNVWGKTKIHNKNKALQVFKEWFEEFPVNVDLVTCPADHANALGLSIAQVVEDPKTRAAALELARIVQNSRSDKASVLRTLLKVYETDGAVFEDMKNWVQDFPLIDIDASNYDFTLSISIGDKIDQLGGDALKALFNRSADHRPKNTPQSKDLHTHARVGWRTDRKLTVLAFGIASAIGYYSIFHRDAAKKKEDQACSKSHLITI